MKEMDLLDLPGMKEEASIDNGGSNILIKPDKDNARKIFSEKS